EPRPADLEGVARDGHERGAVPGGRASLAGRVGRRAGPASRAPGGTRGERDRGEGGDERGGAGHLHDAFHGGTAALPPPHRPSSVQEQSAPAACGTATAPSATRASVASTCITAATSAVAG